MALLKKKENMERLRDLFEFSEQEIQGIKIIDIFLILEILADELDTSVENLDYRVTGQFIQKINVSEPVSLYSAPKNIFNLDKAIEKAKNENNQIVIVETL